VSQIEAKGYIDPEVPTASILALDRQFQGHAEFNSLTSSRSSGSKGPSRDEAPEDTSEQLENPSEGEGQEPEQKKPRKAKGKGKGKGKTKYEKCLEAINKIIEDLHKANDSLQTEEALADDKAQAAFKDSSDLIQNLEKLQKEMDAAIRSGDLAIQDKAGSCIHVNQHVLSFQVHSQPSICDMCITLQQTRQSGRPWTTLTRSRSPLYSGALAPPSRAMQRPTLRSPRRRPRKKRATRTRTQGQLWTTCRWIEHGPWEIRFESRRLPGCLECLCCGGPDGSHS